MQQFAACNSSAQAPQLSCDIISYKFSNVGLEFISANTLAGATIVSRTHAVTPGGKAHLGILDQG